MPRQCTICAHHQRADIDAALVAGETSFRAIARQFQVSKDALARHGAEHLPAQLTQAKAAADVAQADNLLAQVRTLHAKALSILGTAEADGDLRTALAAIREARGTLELLAKLLGELDERPQVNLLIAPEWLTVRTALLAALAPYAEARAAVAAALLTLEAPRAVA